MIEAATANNRIIDVITFLAAHPTESFTLSQLAKRLDMSLGSAHRTLAMLTEARFLARHPKHKTFSLGLALIAIGQAALEKHRNIEIARREMARLAVELNVQCVAMAVVDDELLLIAKEGVPQTHHGLNRVGERRPFIPPLGLCQVAWADHETLEAFFAKAPPCDNDPGHEHLRHAVELIRARGYSIAANGPAIRQLRQISSTPIGAQQDETYWTLVRKTFSSLSLPEIQLDALPSPNSEGVCYISAPVFSPSGDVAFELTLSGMPHNLNARDIMRYAERLRTAAMIVTSESHGRLPG